MTIQFISVDNILFMIPGINRQTKAAAAKQKKNMYNLARRD